MNNETEASVDTLPIRIRCRDLQRLLQDWHLVGGAQSVHPCSREGLAKERTYGGKAKAERLELQCVCRDRGCRERCNRGQCNVLLPCGHGVPLGVQFAVVNGIRRSQF